ncbi:MAG: segregation/condensation protein A [Planctomycetaceae bacterium]|nr:segregation/condensation protein A [Planctomycetaceae bacterium]
MAFRVELEIFRGPLDLLLYLVRKHELDVTDIPIALVTEQYLQYLEVLEALDVDGVGDFLEMASTLVEIKSRMVLPRGGEEQEELDDPRQDLVRQLLEYKKYKDAASMLEERSRSWHDRFARLAHDPPPLAPAAAEQPIREVELWDLVGAFNRVVRERQLSRGPNIVYDDTPIHVYMERIHQRLVASGQLALSEIFVTGQHKSSLVGMFLAVLELVRHQNIRTQQDQLFGEVWLLPPDESAPPPESIAVVDNYDGSARVADGVNATSPQPPAKESSSGPEPAPSAEAKPRKKKRGKPK